MKLFVAVLISLCLSFSNAAQPSSQQQDLCECDLNLINTQISAVLAEQPIVKMLYLGVSSTRTVELRHFSGSTFSIGSLIDSISVSNPAIAVTSTQLAYRPTFNDFHGSDLAGIFINMEAIFPCIADFVLGPVCRIFTAEEDGFNQGRPFIESGDIGNDIQIFSTSSNIATYGFAIQGCTQMDPTCLQSFSQLVIKCLLPREQCS